MLGWSISDETVRHVCYAEAGRVEKWLDDTDLTVEHFAKTNGEIEVQIDAGKVKTVERGWRDFKVMLVLKRPRSAPAVAAQWATRKVNRPSFSMAFGRIEEASSFGPWYQESLKDLQVGDWREVTLLGDGAEWIWNLGESQFPGFQGILDIFHALQALSERSDGCFADSTAKQKWLDGARESLLGDGWFGLTEYLGKWLAESNTADRQQAKDAIIEYFSKHLNHLNYAYRLATGQTIGSGAIEGTIKQFGLRRLKASGVKWRTAHVDCMLSLMGLATSDELWDAYWLAL